MLEYEHFWKVFAITMAVVVFVTVAVIVGWFLLHHGLNAPSTCHRGGRINYC